MPALSVRFPEPLHAWLRRRSYETGASINDIICDLVLSALIDSADWDEHDPIDGAQVAVLGPWEVEWESGDRTATYRVPAAARWAAETQTSASPWQQYEIERDGYRYATGILRVVAEVPDGSERAPRSPWGLSWREYTLD